MIYYVRHLVRSMRQSIFRLVAVSTLLLPILGWAARPAPTGDEHKNLDKLPDSNLGMKCPSGHSEIKVISGARAFPTRCGPLPDETEICAKCIYVYDRKNKFWEREGEDAAEFSIPLSKAIATLPVPAKSVRSRDLSYSQYWKDGRVRWEYVVCRSNESFPEVRTRVKQHLERIQVDVSKAEESPQSFHVSTKWNDYDLEAEVAYVESYKDVYVRIEISAAGSIWEPRN